jgi:hypothetical protein
MTNGLYFYDEHAAWIEKVGKLTSIVIKSGLRVDLVKRSGFRFHRSTRINLKKLQKIYLKLYYFI